MNNTTVRKKRSEYEEYLLSDENIYHAIYSLESYVFDYELLEPEDKILFHRLKDKFVSLGLGEDSFFNDVDTMP